jgi:aminocarboxymuconate-semialdehyde decarboxylase
VFGAAMPTATGRTATGLLTSGLLEQVPELQVLLAHAGGTLPALLDRLEQGWRLGLHPVEQSPATLARRAFWVDSVAYSPAVLHLAAEVLGHDRVVYGSDYPFPALVEPALVRSLLGDDAHQVLEVNGSALLASTSKAVDSGR